MNTHFPNFVIFLTAAVWAGFAIWLSIDPRALLLAFGIEASTPQMLTEIRAFYGGVELGIALAMIVLWFRGERFASLLIGGLPLLGSACGRCLGMMIDGFSTLHVGFAAIELIGAALCMTGCMLVAKE